MSALLPGSRFELAINSLADFRQLIRIMLSCFLSMKLPSSSSMLIFVMFLYFLDFFHSKSMTSPYWGLSKYLSSHNVYLSPSIESPRYLCPFLLSLSQIFSIWPFSGMPPDCQHPGIGLLCCGSSCNYRPSSPLVLFCISRTTFPRSRLLSHIRN